MKFKSFLRCVYEDESLRLRCRSAAWLILKYGPGNFPDYVRLFRQWYVNLEIDKLAKLVP